MAKDSKALIKEQEFFTLEKKGRDGLNEMVLKMGEGLWKTRANYLNVDKDAYFLRAIANIANDDNLKPLLSNRKGMFSIYMELSKALQLGVNIGGQIPQAYLVNFGGTASLIPTAEGYKFIALAAPAVVKDLEIVPIYDGDEIKIPRHGKINHSIAITENKRKLIGIYCTITQLNGQSYNDFISRGDIEDVRDKWSKQPKGKAWGNSFDMMAMKTAAKRFLKPYAAIKEGLMNIISDDDQYDTYTEDNIGGGITDRFDDVADKVDIEPEPEIKDVTPEPEKKEKEPEVKKEAEPKKDTTPEMDIF